MNADILKIDGSLVKGASDDIVSRALINGLVHMADTLGMRTVASQVDSTGKLRAVTQLGVDYAQGFQLRCARAHRLVRVPRRAARSARRRMRLHAPRRHVARRDARLVIAQQLGGEFGEHPHLGEMLGGARIHDAHGRPLAGILAQHLDQPAFGE